MQNKRVILASLLSCFLAVGALKTVNSTDISAKAGWKLAKAAGGGEGAQWAVSGAGGYAGAVAGAWAAAKLGAAVGTTVGPVGTFVGALIGAGAGAW